MDLIILLPVFSAVTIGGLGNVVRRGARRAASLSLAQNLLISVDFGSLLATRSWSCRRQFRDYHRGRRHGRRADPQAAPRPAGDGLSA